MEIDVDGIKAALHRIVYDGQIVEAAQRDALLAQFRREVIGSDGFLLDDRPDEDVAALFVRVLLGYSRVAVAHEEHLAAMGVPARQS